MPLLSLCIPTYNRAPLLNQSLRAILGQITPGMAGQVEVIILDNASPDDTPAIVQRAQDDFPHVPLRPIRHPENIGPDANFYEAVKQAQGEYVYLISDDDVLLPGALETLLGLISKYPQLDAFCPNVRQFQKDPLLEPVPFRVFHLKKDRILPSRDEALLFLRTHITFLSCIVFKKASLAGKDYGDKLATNLAQAHFYLDALAPGHGLYVTSEPLLGQRADNIGGYNFFKVFVTNFRELMRYAAQVGYSPRTVRKATLQQMQYIRQFVLIFKSRNGWGTMKPDYRDGLARLWQVYGPHPFLLFVLAPLMLAPQPLFPPIHRIYRGAKDLLRRQHGSAGADGGNLMQVAFLADILYQRLAAGSARYAAELVRGLHLMPDLDLRLLTLYPPEGVAALAEPRGYPLAQSVPASVPRQLQYLLWHANVPGLPLGNALDGVEVLHTPVLLVPPRRRCPLVVTVHDVAFRRFPQHSNLRTRLVAEAGLKRAVKDAAAFLVPSEHTRQDLIRLAGVAPGRIHLTPLAADARFSPQSDTDGALARYGIRSPYVLYVGTLEPRKNISALVRAFAALDDPAVQLVLAGAKGWLYDEIFASVKQLGLTERVLFTSFVAQEDLPTLYSEAQAFVYPSLFEGFGLPVLEAMQCGAPVITTNVSSLPEVAGDAAILLAPDDVAGLADALRRLLSEPGLREEMRGLGLARAAQFSWRKTAKATAAVYEQVIAEHHNSHPKNSHY